MKIETKAVHAGDRKKAPHGIPSTTPIYGGSTYLYENVEQLDRIFGREVEGFSYSRYDNPTNAALEELCASLENGAGALACASGMSALHTAITAGLVDRPRRILSANALYGATINMLNKVFEPMGTEIEYVDICDLDAVAARIAAFKPGCVVLETVSNPILRVAEIDRLAELTRAAGASLIVDNTFATPMLIRPLELGANLVVHSLTKYLAGHGDMLGGLIVADAAHNEIVRGLSRIYGPVLGPFESYLAMRGIKTFPLRMERHCANACRVASYLSTHPKVEKVNFLADPAHPDAAAVARLFPKGLYGAMVSFDLKDAGRDEVFRFMDALKLIVKGTSLGDVHSLMLYPAIASHREVPPKQRQRMGIRDSLVRLSVGIEAVDDIIADLEQALG